MSLTARFARALEDGAVSPTMAARAASRAWARVASRGVVRPLVIPEGVHVVAVGGATLGGSGKTPVALAVALSYAPSERVVLVGHAYRASPRAARVVSPDDDVAIVGDEALACARAIDAVGARNVSVVVAPRRQAAIDHACAIGASVIVLDGVAQTSPRRASLALLTLDAEAPWGAGVTPPLGDLRAPRAALLDACDRVVVVRDALSDATCVVDGARDVVVANVTSRGVWIEGALASWDEVASLRVGLVTSIARPSRVVAMLARRGVVPIAIAAFADHHPPRIPSRSDVDLWLTTSKGAAYLTDAHGRPRREMRAVLGRAGLAHIDHLADLDGFPGRAGRARHICAVAAIGGSLP